jgi:hypothetical protein
MRETRDYREGLILLHRLPSAARRATFRTSLASLAHAASARQPVPLEGLDPDALLAGIRAAMSESLLDDLDWLSTPSAAVALWEIANALPIGPERRDLGRRVVRHLHDGDAATFIAIATSLALGARKGLRGRGVRARLSLAFELPSTEAEGNETLALALISRSDLARDFLLGPARGNLPGRRFAATLLERASLAAARGAMQDQPEGLRVFAVDEIAATFRKLLADRAPRVHQPAARARGVLSTVLPDLALEVRRDLENERDTVARRRGLLSLAASIAVEAEPANEVLSILRGASDRGLFAAAAAGVRRAVEIEPSACRAIIEEVARGGGPDALDALIDVHLAVGNDVFPQAFAVARARVLEMLESPTEDAGRIAWLEALARDLAPADDRAAPTLRQRVRGALGTFASQGVMAAYEEATAIATMVGEKLDLLTVVDDESADGRRRAYHLVRELDQGVLDLGMLGDLLALRIRTEEEDVDLGIDGWLDRMSAWLCAREERGTADAASLANVTLRAAQLGALVHLADLDGGDGPDATDRTRGRRFRLFRMLLERAHADRTSPFRGAVLEALARACDAVVRDEGSEVCDVLLALAVDLDDPAELEEVAAASVVSELRNAVSVYAELLRAARNGVTSLSGAHAFVVTLLSRTREMPSASSPRLEAFRSALQRFGHAVAAVLSATSLGELRDDADNALLPRVGNAAQAVAQLVSGARRRRGDKVERAVPMSGAMIVTLDALLERRVAGEPVDLMRAVEIATHALREEVPTAIAVVAAFALRHASMLPDRPSQAEDLGSLPSISLIPARRTPLPAWMPPRRTLGGFYILHPLGEGGAASVFVAKRVDERFDERAERFALKVPAYTGAVARTLSEEDFLRMFREEASALLALPQHQNLARFVTFDSGLKPKPILVMEYVEGPTLARVLERRKLTLARALAILDGVAAGLEAMHKGGIAHLDLKPSNVILPKESQSPAPSRTSERPVLVDFGLAGRTLRPGCATLEYGAPEVWGIVEKTTRPMAADVYAFGAVAYEVLTGETLFSGNDEMAVLSAHAIHDGNPEGLAKLPPDVAKLLSSALRRDPSARATITDLRTCLASLATASRTWPLRA